MAPPGTVIAKQDIPRVPPSDLDSPDTSSDDTSGDTTTVTGGTTDTPTRGTTPDATTRQPQTDSTQTPETRSSQSRDFSDRLHVLLTFGYAPWARVAAESDPFAGASSEHWGLNFGLQGTLSVVDNPRDFDVRFGVGLGAQFYQTPNSPTASDSSFTAVPIDAVGEIEWFADRNFSLGANLRLGLLGIFGGSVDVGAPHTANISDFSFHAAVQIFAGTYNGNLRLFGALESNPGGFQIGTGPGNPDLAASFRPTIWAGIGGNIPGFFR